MISRPVYICEMCNKESTNPVEIIKCECSHLGIDLNILNKWRELRDNAAKAGQQYSIRHNADTDAAFDKAVIELVEFERKHNLTGKQMLNTSLAHG